MKFFWGVGAKKGCVEKIPFPAPPNRGKVGGRLVSSIPMKTLNDLLPILQDAKRDLMAPKKLSEFWGKSAPLPDPLPDGERENVVSPFPLAGG